MADQNLDDKEERLMRYIDGLLTPEEKLAFEAQISADATLKAEVESLQLAIAAVDLQQTRERVGRIHTRMKTERLPGKTRVISIKRFAQFGTVAAAAAVILFLVFFPGAPSAGKVYDDIYVEYRASAERGASQPGQFAGAYGSGNYKDIIALFNDGKSGINATDSLFTALAYLKLDSSANAVAILQNLQSSLPVKDDADFYLSLAYLKQHDYSKALELMKKIRMQNGHMYQQQVSDEQLAKVEKLK